MYKFAQYEDCIQLDLPIDMNAINLSNLKWVPYNPRKQIKNRFGCSITSLVGDDSGIPDLDSLLEYNELHNTTYSEKDFTTPTKHATPFLEFMKIFRVGRSHYLRLDPGGFFPWHRDKDPYTIRIIYTIDNCQQNSLIWLEDNEILTLQNQCWYYINTKKKHALFSLEGSVLAVFNVLCDGDTFQKIEEYMMIK